MDLNRTVTTREIFTAQTIAAGGSYTTPEGIPLSHIAGYFSLYLGTDPADGDYKSTMVAGMPDTQKYQLNVGKWKGGSEKIGATSLHIGKLNLHNLGGFPMFSADIEAEMSMVQYRHASNVRC